MKATISIAISRLIARQEIAERTAAFHFEKPSNWNFHAGQFLDMTLIDARQREGQGASRTLSIASGPHEGTLMVAMRDSSFYRSLSTLPLGSPVRIQGPAGNVVLHDDVRRTAVFLAGGIGVTPFRSIACRAAKEKLPHRIFLFYSNRRPEEAPFLDEFKILEEENPNFTLIASMTEMPEARHAWNGEAGPINREMLRRHLKDAYSPVYYVSGPTEMVKEIHSMIRASGVEDADIRGDCLAPYRSCV